MEELARVHWKKHLPIIPPQTQTMYQIETPQHLTRKQQKEETAQSIQARSERLRLTMSELGMHLTIATSTVNRFPFIPDLFKLGVFFDKIAKNKKERLMPARIFAEDVFEAWVG